MNKFSMQENKDFERFSKFVKKFGNISGLRRTEGAYDRWDCEFEDENGLTWRIELKSRNFESTHRFAQEGLILEEDKFQACTENLTRPALYVNLMSDGKIIVFNLDTKLSQFSKVEKKWMNKTTLRNSPKIEKEVRLIKPCLGDIYEG